LFREIEIHAQMMYQNKKTESNLLFGIQPRGRYSFGYKGIPFFQLLRIAGFSSCPNYNSSRFFG
jgi:hypothetical protein